MNIILDSIQLTAEDLSEFAARHSSSQELYSLTAPSDPPAKFGWRDRWWLHGAASEQVAINYWFFQSADDAYTAADAGRFRLSARTVPKSGGRESIYQPVSTDEVDLGDAVWHADANWLFVRHTVVVLVAEIGGQVPNETTLEIARKILEKIERASQ